jgi:signal transduction histidine kinase
MSLGFDEELVSRGIDVVISEADRLSGLVEDMLDFSRMQSGRFSYELRPINIGDVLKEAADMYTELAQKKEIELTVTLPKTDSTVNGDADRLKQVFINIIDNAVKYTNEKGLVLIELSEEDACVKITVKDTGVGVPAQDIDRVKEKFYKANKEVRGSGIGLAVADEIVKQHSGLLFLESTEGIGTTVTVVLPIYEAVEEPIEKVISPDGEELISEQENKQE